MCMDIFGDFYSLANLFPSWELWASEMSRLLLHWLKMWMMGWKWHLVIICITSCVKQWYWIQGLSKLNIYFRDWKMLIIIKSINKCGNSTVACQWILIQISTKIAINLWSLIRWWLWWWWEREQFTLWMF